MLEEYKQLYIQCADLIPNWRKLSVLDLANNYLKFQQNGDERSNSYVSAIICKYWYLINYYYNRQQYKFASPEDCYEWLINAITYALSNHVWTNPDSSIYNDPQAPNKAIMVCISAHCSNFYVASRRQKRILNNKKINFSQLSKFDEETDEECVDRLLGMNYYLDNNNDTWFRDFIRTKIKDSFNKKEYFNAFALDAIVNSNVFKECWDTDKMYVSLDKKRFRHHFRYIKDSFCRWFAKEYGLDIQLVKDSVRYVNNLTNDRFNRNLNKLYYSILSDKDFRIYLGIAQE